MARDCTRVLVRSSGGRRRVAARAPGAGPALSEISWRATTSGGPGGQHANRTLSRVEVQFDVGGLGRRSAPAAGAPVWTGTGPWCAPPPRSRARRPATASWPWSGSPPAGRGPPGRPGAPAHETDQGLPGAAGGGEAPPLGGETPPPGPRRRRLNPISGGGPSSGRPVLPVLPSMPWRHYRRGRVPGPNRPPRPDHPGRGAPGHATSIAFENFDPATGRPVPLDPALVEDKLITRRRAGVLLRAEHVAGGRARITRGLARWSPAGPRPPGPRGHAGPAQPPDLRVVDGDATWLADVGFGGGGLLDPGPFGPSGWRAISGLALPVGGGRQGTRPPGLSGRRVDRHVRVRARGGPAVDIEATGSPRPTPSPLSSRGHGRRPPGRSMPHAVRRGRWQRRGPGASLVERPVGGTSSITEVPLDEVAALLAERSDSGGAPQDGRFGIDGSAGEPQRGDAMARPSSSSPELRVLVGSRPPQGGEGGVALGHQRASSLGSVSPMSSECGKGDPTLSTISPLASGSPFMTAARPRRRQGLPSPPVGRSPCTGAPGRLDQPGPADPGPAQSADLGELGGPAR